MKRINVLIVLSMLSTLFMAMTCEDSGAYQSVTIENRTNDTIWVVAHDAYSRDDSLTSEKVFLHSSDGFRQVLPNDSYNGFKFWVNCATDGKYFYVLVYKQQTLNNYPVLEITKKDLYDAKFSFTYRYLEKMNFKIVYEGK